MDRRSRVLNLTSAASGTSYIVENSFVASVDADGLATAHAGGTTPVLVSNRGIRASTQIRVTGWPPAIDAITVRDSFITLSAPGAQHQLVVL